MSNPKYLRWLHELLFSFYSGLLFVWVEESRGPFAWSANRRVPFLLDSQSPDIRPFYVALFVIPGAALFLSLLLIRRFQFSRFLLRPIAGAVAVFGIPAVHIYRVRGSALPYAWVELVMAATVCVLWAYRKWPVSTPLNVVLLILHYALWSFGGWNHALHKPWEWGIWEYASFVYPLLGFCFTLIWAAYFRQSEVGRPPAHSIEE